MTEPSSTTPAAAPVPVAPTAEPGPAVMPAPTAAPSTSALEVRDLADYALIIDARSPHEYADDHLPGAVNLPVVDDDEFAEVGITYKQDMHRAYLIGVAYSLNNIARQIPPLISRYGPSDRLLVYCFRGGKRSRLWADNLRTIGFEVDVVPGGWKRYRAWVRDSLAHWPAALRYRVLCGPTGCGKTRLLHALADAGEQVLDLEGLASHRGSLIGALPGRPQPPQKLFDSVLLQALRRLDPSRPVWIEAESKKIGQLQLPDALHDAMQHSPTLTLEVPMAERVRLWHEDYAHFVADPAGMVEQLSPLKPIVGGEELDAWRALASARQTAALFERVMERHYDPAYARSTRKLFAGSQAGPRVALESLAPEALAAAARSLARGEG